MGEGSGVYRVLVEKPEEKRDHLEDPCEDGRIILRRIFRKWDVGIWAGLSWLRTELVAGTCECGKEPSGSTKCEESLDYLQTG
jgi:hypothetical protein